MIVKRINIYDIEYKGKFSFKPDDFVKTLNFRDMNYNEAVSHFIKSYSTDSDFNLFCNVLSEGLKKSKYILPSGAGVYFTNKQIKGMITCLEHGVDFRLIINPYLTDTEVENIEKGVIENSYSLLPYSLCKLDTITKESVMYALKKGYDITKYYVMKLSTAHFLLMLEELNCEVRKGKSFTYTIYSKDEDKILFYFNPTKFSSDMIETLKSYIKDGVELDIIAKYITLRYDNNKVILHQKLINIGYKVDIELLPKIDNSICEKIDKALDDGTYSDYMTELLEKELYVDVSKYLELGWSDTKAMLHQALLKNKYKSDIVAIDDLDDKLCSTLLEAINDGTYGEYFTKELNRLQSNLSAMETLNSEDIIKNRKKEEEKVRREQLRSDLIAKYGK